MSMIDLLLNWVNDPAVQGLFLSPLIGAIMGLILTFLVQAPPSAAPHPETIHQTRIVFIKQVRSRRIQSEDGPLVLGAAIFMAFVITWVYARYAVDAIRCWNFATLSFLSFNVASAIAGVMKREITANWLAYLAFPMVALVASLYLAVKASNGLIPNAAELASRYGIIDFYFKVLNASQRNWMLTQSLGIIVGLFATLIAAMRLTYYTALSNQRGGGWWASLWRYVAFFTRRLDGFSGVALAIIFYGLSWVLLSGIVYGWLMQRT
ncbi:hypothetical protein MO328_14075 [Xanthomonas translucens]|uniref:hypothetical protein n=2 Tax=Xanthomonas campestris pv. translucens TaxID=343 RepID=UPI0027153934|nr:hypothetical protein [Xanthomonas translucens]WLA07535.1 hypothetical protein MO328_14075 [Xanthomonas translucens]